MRISDSSTDSFLYEQIVQPIVAKALVKLMEKIEKLRKEYEAAPDEAPEPVRVGKSHVFSVGISKASIGKEISSHEGLLSMLSDYDYESFQADFKFATEKVFVGLRGCMLNRPQVVDQSLDILYPNFERTGQSRFYAEKFKELLSDEFFKDIFFVEDPDDAVRDWGDVYTENTFC